MTIIVEDGTGVTGANSYVSTATLTAFATARSVTLTSGAETLLIQAMDYIESLNYKGIKLSSTQPLQWPRTSVFVDGYYLNSDTIPQQLKDALCQQAIAVDQGTDALQDVPRTVSSERVGDIEVQYANGGAISTVNVKVKSALWKLLVGGGGQLTAGKA